MDLHYLELLEVGRRIAAREISPVEVTEAMLRRIEDVDPMLGSYVHVTADTAIDQARLAEAEIAEGRSRGLLHGVPIALKDMFDTKGVKTAAGMPIRRDNVPDRDSTVVRRLREAGAIFLGNLKMTEGAHAEHHPPFFEAPLNPWNHDLWAGASSSGSGVAAAAGLCYAAMGTDTGGSIRLPSVANRVTGLMPTWGRVSRAGVFELAGMLDHVGPLARSAADAGAVLGAIAGPDPDDPTASFEPVPNYLADLGVGLSEVIVGFDSELAFGQSDAVVEMAILTALEVLSDLGAKIVPVHLPDVTPMVEGYLPLSGVQTAVAHEEAYSTKREEYGRALSSVIALGASLSATAYHKLLIKQMDFRYRVNALFQKVHVLATPVLPFPVPTVTQMATMSDDVIQTIIRFTAPIAASGHPAIAVPTGPYNGPGPVSLQLVGPYFGEAILVKVGNAFQQVTDFHKRRPLP